MIGEITPKTPIAGYQPSQEVADLTVWAKRDYQIGYDILHRPWNELNDYSVIDRLNKDQRTFNAFVDESVEDPAEGWKWRGTRSMARNKTIAMHAQLTGEYMVPSIDAADDKQTDHREMADIMQSIVKWMTLPNNSNYRPSFLLASMGMLVNPVTYLQGEYAQITQETWQRSGADAYQKTEMIDEVLSGFKANTKSADQVLITNAHEQDIQRQNTLTERTWHEYHELEAQYKNHPNWPFVVPGIRMVYNDEDGLFYATKDTEYSFRHLIERTKFKCRQKDTEITYINGIYFGSENVEVNPMTHRDNRGAPKYNLVPFGYQRVNEHFFYFKSLINAISWDDKLMDAVYELYMNRTILDTEMPVAVSGSDKVDTAVIFPGAVSSFEDTNTKIVPLLPASGGMAAEAMQMIESSMSDASVSGLQAGQIPASGGSSRAFMIALANQNAQIIIGALRRTLAQSVSEFGQIMVDIAINNLTTPQVDEIEGVTYRTFLLKDQMVGGKKVSKKIRFDDFLMGHPMTDKQKRQYRMSLLEEVGFPYNKEHLYVVNPYLFSKYKYMAYADADQIEPTTQSEMQTLTTNFYKLVRQDPFIDAETLVRKLAYSYFKSDYEDLMSKGNAPVMMGGMIQKPGAQPQGQPQGKPIPQVNAPANLQSSVHQPSIAQSIGAGG